MPEKAKSSRLSEKKLETLREISGLVEIREVRLCGLSLQTEGDCFNNFANFNKLVVEHGSIPSPDRENNLLSVMVEFSVTLFYGPEEENEIPAIRINGAYELIYELDFHKVSNDEAIDIFAEVNAPFNAWPYIRELVQNLTSRMGIPQLTIPVYKPDTAKKKRYSKKKDESSASL